METQVLIGLLLSLLPVFESRIGIPILVNYTVSRGISVWPYFILSMILNIVAVVFIFLFLDFLHERLMEHASYRRIAGNFIEKTHRKAHRIKEHMETLGFVALTLFVAVPLPGTGAWTGTLIAWMLGLNRKWSIFSIALGILILGLSVLLGSLVFFTKIY